MTGSRLSIAIRRPLRLLLPAVLPVLSLAGCMPQAAPVEDYSRYDFIRDDLSPEVAQLLMQEYTATACGYFDQGVAEVAAAQADAEIAENVERFRDAGLVAIRRAGWRLQPVGAAFDSVILVEQIRAFLDKKEAKTSLGPARIGLIAVVDRLEPLAAQVLEQITVDPEATRSDLISSWVRENPLDGLELTRLSPLLGVAEQTDRIESPMQSIARVQFSAAAAYARLNDAFLALPADVRRQIEGVVRGIMREPILVNALIGFARLGDGMKETGKALSAIDAHIDDHRDAVLADIERQRADTIEVIRSEREIVLAAITAERQAVVDVIASERLAITDAVAVERAAILTSVDTQVGRILDSTDGLGERVVDRAADRLDGIVFSAASVIAGGLFLGLAAIGVLLRTRPVRT